MSEADGEARAADAGAEARVAEARVAESGVEARVAGQAAMLGNRIAKNARHLAKWARRDGVDCYRVYDCDIPELPLTIDRYGAEHALVSVWEDKVARPRAWLDAMCGAIATTLAVPRANLHLKARARQEGAAQYERLAQADVRIPVQEDGLTFLVNLDDYLDTGLFLDHRLMRRRVRGEAAGRHMLNLFAYTGAFSVHAAAGGAATTTSVDLSQTYLDWARDNLAANGFREDRHQLVRADIVQWLEAPSSQRWDLAVVDPPTFSNSKKMRGVFDVQRDHPQLLRRVFERMSRGAIVYFSTNARRFKLAPDAFEGATKVDDISRETVPVDFRDEKIHRAWRVELG